MGDDISGLPTWITAGIVSIIGALGSAVVLMFKLGKAETAKMLELEQQRHTKVLEQLSKDRDELQMEAKECRKDREDMRVQIARLETRIEILGVKLENEGL